jgi:hypothetical protein
VKLAFQFNITGKVMFHPTANIGTHRAISVTIKSRKGKTRCFSLCFSFFSCSCFTAVLGSSCLDSVIPKWPPFGSLKLIYQNETNFNIFVKQFK